MKYSLLALILHSTALSASPVSQKCIPEALSYTPTATDTAMSSMSSVVSVTPNILSTAPEAAKTSVVSSVVSAIASVVISDVVPSVMELVNSDTTNTADTNNIPSGAQKEVSTQGQDVLALFAAYSGAAYTVTDSWNCPYACQYPGTEDTVIEHHWDVGFPPSAGYIARNPSGRFLVIAFQGTGEMSQWADNINIAQAPWPAEIPESRVHSGFLRGYTSVQDQVMSNLKSLASQYPDYSIVIVGHSLGGARAALCLLDLSVKMPELLSRTYLYTQGQPRTGNKQFADAIDALSVPTYRGVYEYDMATRLPLTTMGYHHHSTEAWYHSNDTLLCIQPNADDSCADNGDFLHPLSIHDHFGYPGLKYE
ncbi:hypothetical protein EV176_003723 [Coemansia sp. RSA 451]|nr:hypothetical protein EV176_003723 [Coemansia sp. RSA 451]